MAINKKSKSGIFRSYRDMDRPDKNAWIKEMAREIRSEQMKLAKKEEELAHKREIVAQLKDAQQEIEMNIHHSLISKDIVLFAYNYYRKIICMHASEDQDLETLEFYGSLPHKVEDWDLPLNIYIMYKYLPLEYNHNDLLGAYTVRDLLGGARGKLLGISDCSEDFFDNHCKFKCRYDL